MIHVRYGRSYNLDDFRPQLTPVEMLERGVFGGGYFCYARDADMEGLGAALELAQRDRRRPLYKRNAYGVRSGMSFAEWAERGWIFPEDPLGWFHWYCRWHAGRRHERDPDQMARWINYGERWGSMGRAMTRTLGEPSPVVLQGYLQWSYEPMRLMLDHPEACV